jgi:hypothetical protein
MKNYTVMVRGIPHRMQLDEEHAKRLGAVPIEEAVAHSVASPKPVRKGRAPANKNRTVADK